MIWFVIRMKYVEYKAFLRKFYVAKRPRMFQTTRGEEILESSRFTKHVTRRYRYIFSHACSNSMHFNMQIVITTSPSRTGQRSNRTLKNCRYVCSRKNKWRKSLAENAITKIMKTHKQWRNGARKNCWREKGSNFALPAHRWMDLGRSIPLTIFHSETFRT